MTKLELFKHQYDRLKRLYVRYEKMVTSGNESALVSQVAFDNCTRINQIIFDLHVKYNNGNNDSVQSGVREEVPHEEGL